MVSVGAIERDVLAGCQVRVPIVFVARGAEPGSAKCAFGHYLLPPRRLAISIGNTGYPDKIPVTRRVQPRFAQVTRKSADGTRVPGTTNIAAACGRKQVSAPA